MDTTREKTNVAVQWDYPLQPVYIVTDGGKLRQILENLIGNALKFTDHGIVTVSARLLQSGNGSGHPSRFAHSRCVEFKVTDTGVGIPDEQFHSIFDKFYQVDSSETRLYGGIGLGLYIVKHFTELLGGEIRVDSERGKGSTFTLTLPYAS